MGHAPEAVTGEPAQIGSLVETIATTMMTISEIAASRVKRPRVISVPQTSSTVPTKGPITSGNGIPMLAKRPTLRISGKTSF